MLNKFNFHEIRAFISNLSKSMNKDALAAYLQSYAEKTGVRDYKEKAAQELVCIAGPDEIIPDVYKEYRLIIRDGFLFLFSNLCLKRFISIFIDQALMDENAETGERLVKIAEQVPTLHKLGQIIARNRNIDPVFKKRLIHLENTSYGTDLSSIKELIDEQINSYIDIFSISVDDKILSQASVGAVTGFTWTMPDSDKMLRGVFKVIKPGVKEFLEEEFAILDKLAVFFDKNRESYPLKDFGFIKTFKEIKQALQEEVNLCGEQTHIRHARCFYKKEDKVKIPELLCFSGQNVTAMELINGKKITDFPMSWSERRECAKILFRAMIWKPLFSSKEVSLFHGDPHAGNIYAVKTGLLKSDYENPGFKHEIMPVLLDWSLAGSFSRSCRVKIIRLILAVFLNDENRIFKSVRAVAENIKDSDFSLRVKKVINNIQKSSEYAEQGFLGRAFYFIDQLALNGVCFSKDMMLFRKAFFTLDGVLNDLDPGFDMDKYLFRLVKDIFIQDLPKRWLYSMMPHMDCSENYSSLVSTRELQVFLMQFSLVRWFSGWRSYALI
ncbi:UbiB domain-containing protein [Desulfonema limicola]|uniref:UbiB domain-containing protein n=1 Tax=Desulfonema limicola TaxID=45656 RepID=A0A975BDG8_9BACT|nr:AarF/UbiB family protein [Desulfonema limicola]QTA83342.1 UbiB domain-containing protein [Desulfonema limicola]